MSGICSACGQIIPYGRGERVPDQVFTTHGSGTCANSEMIRLSDLLKTESARLAEAKLLIITALHHVDATLRQPLLKEHRDDLVRYRGDIAAFLDGEG